jgi:transposase
MKKRRRFTPEFKAQVVLEVLSGVQSPAEVGRKHALRPNLLTTGKTAFFERAHTLFQGDEQRNEDQSRIAEWSNCSAGPPARSRSENKPRCCWMRPRTETGGDQHTPG